MACNDCNTTGGATTPGKIYGSRESGLSKPFIYSRATLNVHSLRAPNIIIFNENPYLSIGSKFTLLNPSVARNAGVNPIAECQTVTALPALVGGRYEVTTDDTFVSLTGSPTVVFAATTALGGFSTALGCGTGATTSKQLQAVICDGTAIASNFSGYLYVSPPGSNPTQVLVNITSNSPEVLIKGRVSSGIKKGDKLEISQTALVGAAAATVINVISGRNASTNERVTQLVLNVPVTGITAAAVGGEICTSATATPQSITPLIFTVTCGCVVTMSVPSTVTSSASFPSGRPIENQQCGQTEYCYTMRDATPGSDKPFTLGVAVL